ncbi:hypothetical protein BC937DRAFT_95129 [Endogone sp. FLAS-F59071]|nr:hypothetical protein BC937DRAFT_95129 [Endogone sp. FLAS-F59071]|eukprot:RUS20473.1 hypothetical protein BC937DRAFT_95129 [Endogone sp. FLAS-F59071]
MDLDFAPSYQHSSAEMVFKARSKTSRQSVIAMSPFDRRQSDDRLSNDSSAAKTGGARRWSTFGLKNGNQDQDTASQNIPTNPSPSPSPLPFPEKVQPSVHTYPKQFSGIPGLRRKTSKSVSSLFERYQADTPSPSNLSSSSPDIQHHHTSSGGSTGGTTTATVTGVSSARLSTDNGTRGSTSGKRLSRLLHISTNHNQTHGISTAPSSPRDVREARPSEDFRPESPGSSRKSKKRGLFGLLAAGNKEGMRGRSKSEALPPQPSMIDSIQMQNRSQEYNEYRSQPGNISSPIYDSLHRVPSHGYAPSIKTQKGLGGLLDKWMSRRDSVTRGQRSRRGEAELPTRHGRPADDDGDDQSDQWSLGWRETQAAAAAGSSSSTGGARATTEPYQIPPWDKSLTEVARRRKSVESDQGLGSEALKALFGPQGLKDTSTGGGSGGESGGASGEGGGSRGRKGGQAEGSEVGKRSNNDYVKYLGSMQRGGGYYDLGKEKDEEAEKRDSEDIKDEPYWNFDEPTVVSEPLRRLYEDVATSLETPALQNITRDVGETTHSQNNNGTRYTSKVETTDASTYKLSKMKEAYSQSIASISDIPKADVYPQSYVREVVAKIDAQELPHSPAIARDATQVEPNPPKNITRSATKIEPSSLKNTARDAVKFEPIPPRNIARYLAAKADSIPAQSPTRPAVKIDTTPPMGTRYTAKAEDSPATEDDADTIAAVVQAVLEGGSISMRKGSISMRKASPVAKTLPKSIDDGTDRTRKGKVPEEKEQNKELQNETIPPQPAVSENPVVESPLCETASSVPRSTSTSNHPLTLGANSLDPLLSLEMGENSLRAINPRNPSPLRSSSSLNQRRHQRIHNSRSSPLFPSTNLQPDGSRITGARSSLLQEQPDYAQALKRHSVLVSSDAEQAIQLSEMVPLPESADQEVPEPGYYNLDKQSGYTVTTIELDDLDDEVPTMPTMPTLLLGLNASTSTESNTHLADSPLFASEVVSPMESFTQTRRRSAGDNLILPVLPTQSASLPLPRDLPPMQPLKIDPIELSLDKKEEPDWDALRRELDGPIKITHYRLIRLPHGFLVALKNIRQLYLDHNQFRDLPDELLVLSQLEILSVSHNRLVHLSDNLWHLAQLRVLNVAHNVLKSLPKTLGRLASLEVINAEQNNLVTLPGSVGSLENLKVLKLKGNPLVSLPNSMSRLTGLTMFHVGEWPEDGYSVSRMHSDSSPSTSSNRGKDNLSQQIERRLLWRMHETVLNRLRDIEEGSSDLPLSLNAPTPTPSTSSSSTTSKFSRPIQDEAPPLPGSIVLADMDRVAMLRKIYAQVVATVRRMQEEEEQEELSRQKLAEIPTGLGTVTGRAVDGSAARPGHGVAHQHHLFKGNTTHVARLNALYA